MLFVCEEFDDLFVFVDEFGVVVLLVIWCVCECDMFWVVVVLVVFG